MDVADGITKIPNLPPEIKEAVNNDRLAVFIGAGVSRLVGCKGWDQLAQNLINKCFTTLKSDGSTCINFREKETLSQLNDHKKIITICYDILKRNNREDAFYEELNKALEPDDFLLRTRNIYDELHGLRGLFITTNADRCFDRKFNPNQIVYNINDFDPSNIDRTKLYHIHGSIEDYNSLVFTVPQYIKRYNNERFRKFLEVIFERYVVLFVGYGIAEFELLDFIITKFYGAKNKELKHFTLQPFYRGEDNILAFEQSYYNSMGIKVLGYEKDEKGYAQLYEVIKEWNKTINLTSTYLYDSFMILDDAIQNPDYQKIDRVLQIIKNDQPQRNYFFRKLLNASNLIIWLEPLKEHGYFNPKNNPKPKEVPDHKGYFTIPNWDILNYLERVSEKNSYHPETKVTKLLIEIIDSIIEYTDENGNRIDNYRTDWALIKIIFNLPIEEIKNKYIDYIGKALNSKWNTHLVDSEIQDTVLPLLLNSNSKELLLSLLDIILSYKKEIQKNGSSKYVSLMDEYYLFNTLKKYKFDIAKLCGIEAIALALNKIDRIISESKHEFDLIWIPTIEDHQQNSFLDKYETQLVHFVRDMLKFSDPLKMSPIIDELLKKEHQIYKRIVIYTINVHYDTLNHYFWNWSKNPLEDYALKHETYELIKRNCTKFSKEQINTVLHWIEHCNYFIPEDDQKDKSYVNKILAYKKKEWISSLLESNDKDVIELYEKYNAVNPVEISHPGFSFYMESWSGSISPIEVQDLIIKSNLEIAKYIEQFEEQDGWKTPTKEGLADCLRNCVIEDPHKFSVDLKPFETIDARYQYSIILGFKEAWGKQKKFLWNNVLNFIKNIITTEKFWDKKYDKQSYNYRNWVITAITDLIEEGTKDDNNAIEIELMDIAEEILLLLINKVDSKEGNVDDYIDFTLNSLKGRLFSAMIYYSLRFARATVANTNIKWKKSIKDVFLKELTQGESISIELLVVLGEFLPNIHYLDQLWLIDKINNIFPKDNDELWEAAFTGYLWGSNKIYKDVYFLLRENGHYQKAILHDFKKTYGSEQLVQHICIGYIEEWENLDDSKSLISILLSTKKIKYIQEIIDFFWRISDKINKKAKNKIKALWEKLYDILMEKQQDPENQQALSKLIKWIEFVDYIDDQIAEWLKTSVRYSRNEYTMYSLIEELCKHVEITPVPVGEIILEMLETGLYIDYKKDEIIRIVETLYKEGQLEYADKICILYGEKGFEFLKEIYIKNHTKTLIK
jgi:SIR2-like domain